MKLNKAQLAALAAGATQAEVAALASAPDPVEASAADPAGAAPAGAAPDASTSSVTGTVSASADANPATAPAPAAAQPSELVAHLTGQLNEANAALLAAKVEAETFKAQAASVDGLVATLRAALGEKLVALGASAETAAGYTASTIAAEFKRIDAVFKSQFRVGGVAAVASPEDKKPDAIDPMLAEALKHSLIK